MRDDVSMGTGAGSGTFEHGGGATVGAGTYHGGGVSTGTGNVWHAVQEVVQDLGRVTVALVLVLMFAFAIAATVRATRPHPVQAAVLVTSQGDVLASSSSCEQDSARLDVDNLPCRRQHPGLR